MTKNNSNSMQVVKNTPDNQNELITWIKAHKPELIIVGISIPTIIAVALGIKNKDAIEALWNSLKTAIEERNMYSPKWFKSASDSVLHSERERVRLAYCSSGNDMSLATQLENLLSRFDKELSNRAWAGQTPSGPSYHREHGFNLYKPD